MFKKLSFRAAFLLVDGYLEGLLLEGWLLEGLLLEGLKGGEIGCGKPCTPLPVYPSTLLPSTLPPKLISVNLLKKQATNAILYSPYETRCLMRKPAILIYLPLMLILSLPYMLVAYIASRFSRDWGRKLAYGFGRPYSLGILHIMGANLKVTGWENIPEENCLFMANHRSLLDSPLLMAIVKNPLSFVSKMEMKKVPILSWWMILLECLFLDRSNNKEGLKIILKGIQQLKNGDNMAIFPQGTRSEGDEFLPFKAGSFKLATKSKKPIVPIALYGTADVFENNGFNLKPGDVQVRIFPAVETKDLTPEEQKALPHQLETLIRQQFETFRAQAKGEK